MKIKSYPTEDAAKQAIPALTALLPEIVPPLKLDVTVQAHPGGFVPEFAILAPASNLEQLTAVCAKLDTLDGWLLARTVLVHTGPGLHVLVLMRGE